MTDANITEKYNKAVQFEKNGDALKALQEYASIIKIDKNFRDAYISMASIYSKMNKLNQAMKYYNHALSIGIDHITLFNIGCLHYRKKEYKKAVIHLEKSKKIDQKFILATLVMGLCYSKLKNIKAAKINFIAVLKVQPSHRVALTALSIIYYNEKRFDDAILLLNKLLVKDSSNILVRELKSNIHYLKGEVDESVKEIKSLKQISDGYTIYDKFISSVPIDTFTDKYGTLDEKISFLNEQLENDKNNLIPLSLCHLLKGDTDAAIEYLFKAKKD